MPRESGASPSNGGYSEKYMTQHARLNGHPESAYNRKQEPGVFERLKNYIGWQERQGAGTVGGAEGVAKGIKAGVLK